MQAPLLLPIAGDETFLVRDAAPLGIPAHRLRSRHLHVPTRGVRQVAPPTSLIGRARGMAPALPYGAMFSHQTAALLHGLPLPLRLQVEGAPLHITTRTGTAAVRRAGVIGHRGAQLRTSTTVRDVPATSGRDTWLDLAPHLSIHDLVVLGDAVVGADAEALAALRRLVAGSRGIRGVVKARAALDLVRLGSRSPRESLTRLIFLEGGLPEPELNADAHDAHGGWLATVDFLWRDQRVVVEYDGDVHADPDQRRKDAHRRRLLTAAGWTVVVLTSADIPRRAPTVVEDIRRLLAR
ncbi:endonuclease domain-containing protein [Luteipulveratus flavus]|uniref:DUF559 domain-containing protein n=1 Tax=Luteipulveratus flavus TaxID=3031728 RepID=A0ABT6C323_9MICO|nr:DUF559 domain-containing protein [Luteipulveratus sp. YIM 133296]MDF8263130.1 DUF559 domain-containing protein [Luteipulveratus sp. YIM 133296]